MYSDLGRCVAAAFRGKRDIVCVAAAFRGKRCCMHAYYLMRAAGCSLSPLSIYNQYPGLAPSGLLLQMRVQFLKGDLL